MRKHKTFYLIVFVVVMFSVLASSIACTDGTYIIAFYDGNQLVGTVKTAGNELINLPKANDKNGYTFVGWYLDKDTWQQEFNADAYATKPLDRNIRVYAYYKINQPTPAKFNIVFYDGDSVVSTLTTAGNEQITLPVAEQKEGYTFEGWYFDKDIWQDELTAQTYVDKALESDIKVYAYYKEKPAPQPEEYTISFYDGNRVVSTLTTAGNEQITLPVAEQKEGYTFEGWYFDKDIWQDELTVQTYVDKALESDIKVYAYYKEKPAPQPEEYTISFYDGNSVVSKLTTAGNEQITLPVAEQKDGYTFEGWYFDKDIWQDELTAQTYVDKALESDIKVYAYYKEKPAPQPEEYTISFYDGDSVVSTLTTAGNEQITLPVAEQKEGYTFEGWYFDKDTWQDELTAQTYVDKALESDIKVYAYYKEIPAPQPEEYTISFYDGDSVVSTLTTAGNEQITLPVAEQKEGFTFEGWYFDKDTWQDELTAQTYVDKALESDIKVYAYYKEKPAPQPEEYTISFYDGDSVVSTLTTAGNEQITLPVAEQKDGYTFEGWYFDKDIWQDELTAQTYVDKALERDIKVYAYYKEIPKFKVTFDTDGGSEVEPITTYLIKTAPVTTKNGYEFAGWYTDSLLTQKVEFPYYVQEEMTFYAKWEQLKVEFIIDGGYIMGAKNLTGSDVELTIPASVNGVKVLGIEANAFKGNKAISKLTIEDGVKYIMFSAFNSCTNLKQVIMPDSIISIGMSAFEYCYNLTDVRLSQGLVSMNYNVFASTAITQVVLPDGVKSLGKYVFSKCSNLVSVDLGQVETIDQNAFEYCTSLRKIVLPDSLTDLSEANYMFAGCSALDEIIFPKKDIKIISTILNESAYYNNKSNWENGLLYVGNFLITAGEGIENSTVCNVKSGTTVIAKWAFNYYKCRNLTTINLPEGLKIIGEGAFGECNKLADISLPDSVEAIGSGAFDYTLLYENSSYWHNNGFYLGNWLIDVKDVAMTSFEVREGTIGIVDSNSALFGYNANKIKQLSLPQSLKYIGDYSFSGLSIESVQLPSSLVKIGNYAFYNCNSLSQINFEDCLSLESIGYVAFQGANFTEITLPASIKTIGRMPFNHNSSNLTINCNLKEKPQGWDDLWAHTYSQSYSITVNWIG